MGELMTIKNIGFIGLGAMGSVMAPLIVKSGCNVLGYDIKAKIDKSSGVKQVKDCLLYTSPSPRDLSTSRMPSSA